MTKDEALRLALEYVELVPDDRYNAEHIDQDELITAIKAALEAKDEPDHSDELTIAYMSGLHRGKELEQRTWVGLTDEDLPALAGDNGKIMELQQVRRFAKIIEAKLRKKNT
jgi:hypothetical protein